MSEFGGSSDFTMATSALRHLRRSSKFSTSVLWCGSPQAGSSPGAWALVCPLYYLQKERSPERIGQAGPAQPKREEGAASPGLPLKRRTPAAGYATGSSFPSVAADVGYAPGRYRSNFAADPSHAAGRPRPSFTADLQSYHKLITQINDRGRPYLVRHVYEHMLLDGVQPKRETFFLLTVGCLGSLRLQDVMFFLDEMKAMGIIPDVLLYNCVIAACGRSHQVDRAFKVVEEMQQAGVQPKHRTYVSLIRACSLDGRVDEAYGVMRKMAASGFTFDSDCYAALITAYGNRSLKTEETVQKIFELLEQAKNHSRTTLDTMAFAATGEAEVDEGAEDLVSRYVPWDDDVPVRNPQLSVYHAAISAFFCTRKKDGKEVKLVVKMIEDAGLSADAYCSRQLIKCYIADRDYGKACIEFDKFFEAGGRPNVDLYVMMVDGALTLPSPENSARAQKILEQMTANGLYVRLASALELFSKACQVKTRDIGVANILWEMIQRRNFKLSNKLIVDYNAALESAKVPLDDPRRIEVTQLMPKFRPSRAGAVVGLGGTAVASEPGLHSIRDVVSAGPSTVTEGGPGGTGEPETHERHEVASAGPTTVSEGGPRRVGEPGSHDFGELASAVVPTVEEEVLGEITAPGSGEVREVVLAAELDAEGGLGWSEDPESQGLREVAPATPITVAEGGVEGFGELESQELQEVPSAVQSTVAEGGQEYNEQSQKATEGTVPVSV